MLKKPKFKSCFHVESVESEGLFLLAENHSFLLSGRLYQQLATLIDGQHTVDEIVDNLAEQASMAEVYYALMLMEEKGYLVEHDDRLPTTVTAFYETLNVDIPQAIQQLQTTKVIVRSVGAVTVEPLISALEALDIRVDTSVKNPPTPTSPIPLSKERTVQEITNVLEVVLTDDYLHHDLAMVNQNALQSQRPWLLVKPIGTILWLGPIFWPGKTGCWECLAQRLRANRPIEAFIQKHQKNAVPFSTSLASLPSTRQLAVNLVATEIAKWISQGKNQKLEGQLVTFNTLSLETHRHILTQRPQCPSCGQSLPYQQAQPIVLTPRRKQFTTDGGHRSLSPAETLKKYEHHISPITGVVRGVNLIPLDNKQLTPIYVAGHNFANMFDELYFLRENVRGRSAGKGKTDVQAKASGFCEAIERYSGIFQGDEIRQKANYLQMGEAAIPPNQCMNFSEQQYQTRHTWNQQCPYFQKVPEPFDEERKIDWTPLWSLTYQHFKYLPTAYCYYGYPKFHQPDCWADANGSSAGNNIEEAILQGFMEVVERDSAALWWYNRIKRAKVDLDSFDEPYFQALTEYYQTRHRELWVLEITSDFTMPVFVAISRRTDRKIEDITLGFGAHFDPKIAILRALTEMNQMLPAVSWFDADGNTQYPNDDQGTVEWLKTATLENQPYLKPDIHQPPKCYSDYAQLWHEDLRDDVMTCVKIAAEHDLEVLILDQTRPDIGLNVVKVVVPGMRHFWKRLAPGRLYDIPVKQGWLSKPLSENQLNPMPIFF